MSRLLGKQSKVQIFGGDRKNQHFIYEATSNRLNLENAGQLSVRTFLASQLNDYSLSFQNYISLVIWHISELGLLILRKAPCLRIFKENKFLLKKKGKYHGRNLTVRSLICSVNNLYRPPNTIGMTKWKQQRWPVHVTCKVDMKNAQIWGRKSERRGSFGQADVFK